MQELRALQAEIVDEIKLNKRTRDHRRAIAAEGLEDSRREIEEEACLEEDADYSEEDEDDVDYAGARIFRRLPPEPFKAKLIVPRCMRVGGLDAEHVVEAADPAGGCSERSSTFGVLSL